MTKRDFLNGFLPRASALCLRRVPSESTSCLSLAAQPCASATCIVPRASRFSVAGYTKIRIVIS